MNEALSNQIQLFKSVFKCREDVFAVLGRVQRSEVTPTIYDYRDIKIDYLNKLFLKRNTFYRKIDKQASLFDEPTEEIADTNTITIERQIKVPVQHAHKIKRNKKKKGFER